LFAVLEQRLGADVNRPNFVLPPALSEKHVGSRMRLASACEKHWFETHGVGKKEFKRNPYLD
jgi:hypothetical protein